MTASIDQAAATEVLQLCQQATDCMCDIIEIIEKRVPVDKQFILRSEAAFVIGEIYGRLMRKIHQEHPELVPDYLR